MRAFLALHHSCATRLKARHGDAEWGAGHVVQANAVEEMDGLGIPAMLTAHTKLQVRFSLAASLNPFFNESANAVDVDGLKR